MKISKTICFLTLLLCASFPLIVSAQNASLTHRYAFSGDADDSVGTLNGNLTAAGTGLEAPLFGMDRPTGADTSFATQSIEFGMNVGTAASSVNFGAGAQVRIYDGKAGSVAYWFKADALLGGARDMFSNIGGASGLRTLTQNSGELRIAGADMGNQNFSFNTTVTADTWHHFALTWDDNAGTGSIALDGDIKTFTFTAGALTDPSRLILGNFAENDSQLGTQFDGRFYDLQIYEGTLSSLEIADLAANPGTAIPESGNLALIGALFALAIVVLRRRAA